MLFNSLSYAVFLPIVFALYWLLQHKYRWILLLVASYYFYMSWNPKYVVLIFGTTVISYLSAILLEKSEHKKMILICATTVCLGVLFIFKYYNFMIESIVGVLRNFSLNINVNTLNLILPVGISFYTFQTLSYVIDVYRGNIKAEKHFGYYATFISFFPQLVAGPVERTVNLLPQIKKENHFDYSLATYGLKLMAWGYFKKLVIADGLGMYVDKIYNYPMNYRGFCFVVATLFFTIQIYCDFSGYSDIAIGTAKLMGINLMTNFKSPYLSSSIKEFWSRWHISLSTWFRDYVYIPLGGSKKGNLKHNRNLLVTFLASGLWHGANWTYVIWGGLHGFAQIIEKNIGKKRADKTTAIIIRTFVVFAFCNVAWIFFRANSIGDIGYIFSHFLDGIGNPLMYFKLGFTDMGVGKERLLILMLMVGILFIYDYFSLKTDVINKISEMRKPVRYIYYFAIITVILCFRAAGEAAFVYFQF